MVPVLTNGGRSFKGAALYYLHDKRAAGEAERLTSERVAWTETVNLLTDDPERAWRMMATTAMMQADLKKAAGIKATGRKLETPALAYSLAWHPDEKPDREQQAAAARETLKILGLEEHQAIIVCHNDEPHAHVHVIVNRVHPTTGKAATLSNSKLALSKWAQGYEEKNGKILCPQRPENNARRKRGEKVQEPRVPRPIYEFRKATAGNDSISADFVRAEQKQKDAALAARGRAMHESHRRQWESLKRTYAEGKAKIYGFGDTRRQQTADAVKEAHKPEWAALFRRQREELKAFEARQRSPLGRFRNIAEAIRDQGWQDGTAKGVLGAVFGRASGQARAAFDQRQQEEREALAGTVRASVAGATAAVKTDTRAELARLRDDYLTRCEALKIQQDAERGELREDWKARNDERREAFAPVQDRAAQWDRLRELGDAGRTQGRGVFRGNDLSRSRDPSPE